MAMGSTGTVNISPEMMNSALKAIDDYRTTTGNLYTQLEGTVNGLIPGNFSGSAADGFKHFFENTITPAAVKGLTDLLDSLQTIIEDTRKLIPDPEGLDDELGNGNKNL